MQLSPLSMLCLRDDFETIILEARPNEMVVVALRLSGLDNKEIAALLNITGSAVGHRIRCYQERICAKHPNLAWMVAGRKMKPGRRDRYKSLGDWIPESLEGDHDDKET